MPMKPPTTAEVHKAHQKSVGAPGHSMLANWRRVVTIVAAMLKEMDSALRTWGVEPPVPMVFWLLASPVDDIPTSFLFARPLQAGSVNIRVQST
jgi:hypothetical protein